MTPFVDVLMWIFGAILCILFLFIAFSGVIIIISLFKRPKFERYTPKVSIVVPVHNESKNIESCLKCIFSSKYPKELYEVIVVDDGSTDDSVQLVRRFKDVRLIRLNHKGKSAALNLGIKNCKYEIVLTLDADTLLQRETLMRIVLPFSDKSVGATIGTYKVGNRVNMLTAFQAIEYSYNNLIRMGFSRVFRDSVWFYGAMSCYRKSALEKAGKIHADTLTEDMDISIRLQNKGYTVIHVHDAYSTTIVPETIKGFFKQRIRWWTGVLQSMHKNRKQSYNNIFHRPSSASKLSSDAPKHSKIPLMFVYLNQWWWSVFALISFPMFIIQIMYWLPYNLATFTDTFMYLFRWFSMLGPLYSIYMIPVWGINFFSIFGILAGLISVTFIIVSVTIFRDTVRLREVLAIFFYFPYTLMLNSVILVSVIKYMLSDTEGFVK
jgi:cellulose synthase/poly-beta-1,6-N-acetylglucosamine synthase-like glycosyltransferase